MNRILLSVFILLLSLQYIKAQEAETKDSNSFEHTTFKDRFFHCSGYAAITDFDRTGIHDVSYTRPQTLLGDPLDVNYSGKSSGISLGIYTYIHTFRFNIFEPSEDISLSINSPIAIGASIFIASINGVPNNPAFSTDLTGGIGFMKLSLPLYLQANFGNIATRFSSEEDGFTAGIGFEYQVNPIFVITEQNLKNVTFPKSNFLMPSMNVGYIYLDHNNVPHEINLKLGFGSTDNSQYIFPALPDSHYNIMLSFHKYVNF